MSEVLLQRARHAMAHINKVLCSINDENADRCVDIFRRPDGSVGFEEYRRDVEDGRGWFPVGFFAERAFATQDDAMKAALTHVSWLKDAPALRSI